MLFYTSNQVVNRNLNVFFGKTLKSLLFIGSLIFGTLILIPIALLTDEFENERQLEDE